MRFELYREASVFEQLGAEWNALLERGVTRVPFLRAEYQAVWWEGRGGGEWPAAELLVCAARGERGELLGVAPLFQAANREGRPALLLVGAIEISDYLDFVVAREDAEAFCAGLLDRLAAADVAGWEVLDLHNVPEFRSPTRAALGRAAAAQGWTASEALLQPVPVIVLPGDWETYLATQVDKKERQEIRRKLRRVEGGDDRVNWYMVDGTGERDVVVETEAFLDLMALNPDKSQFLTPAMRAQFRAIASAMAANGWLRLAVLEINGEKVGAYLNFDYNNRLWVYNSAINPRYMSLSPGWVILAYLLRWANENKRAAVDFLREAEDYKFRFGAVAGKIYRVQVARELPLEALGGEPACMMNEFEADFFPPAG